MADLRYEAPTSVEGVVALLAGSQGVTRLLAGGTDVLVQLHAGMIEPELVIDIKKVAELHGIRREAGGWRVGAAVTGMQLIDHKEFARTFPGVVDGVKLIGSIQVKGRATVVGNLCNASPAADSIPGLIAVDAIADIVGPNGKRQVAVADLPVGPGRTSLVKGEVVTSLFFADPAPHSGSAYQRFTPRTEMDIAVVSCAVNLTLDASGTCTAARMALGAVAERPLFVAEAGAALVGTRVDAAVMDRLADIAMAACRPIDDKRGTKEFRIKVAGVLARRVATIALERAGTN